MEIQRLCPYQESVALSPICYPYLSKLLSVVWQVRGPDISLSLLNNVGCGIKPGDVSSAGVKPQSGKWTSEATEKFKVLVMNKILSASVMADCDRVLTLELIDESVAPKISISQQLIDAGLAVPNTPDCESPAKEEASQPEDHAVQLRWAELPLGQETEVLVCMLQNPGEFFCHIHSQTGGVCYFY